MTLRESMSMFGKRVGMAALAFSLLGGVAFAEDHAGSSAGESHAEGGEGHYAPPRQSWSFWGPFGKFDQAQLQRGFKVYKDVCANCHALSGIAFRNLADPGGPGFSAGQVKELAATYQIKDGPNDSGDMFERPGRPSDHFPPPFPNEQAARASLGAYPPNMSVLAKARGFPRGFPNFLLDALVQYQEKGPDYIYALLTGYTKADDPNYNVAFPGHKIGMPKPLSDGLVEYTDGSPQTVDQYARDISAFLMWAAEPKLEERKAVGFRVIIFLIVFATLLFFVKKRIWAKVHGHAKHA